MPYSFFSSSTARSAALNETTYDAGLAGLGYDVSPDCSGAAVYFSFWGFSHQLPVLLDTVTAAATRLGGAGDTVLQPAFDRAKDVALRRLRAFSQAQPQERADCVADSYMRSTGFCFAPASLPPPSLHAQTYVYRATHPTHATASLPQHYT